MLSKVKKETFCLPDYDKTGRTNLPLLLVVLPNRVIQNVNVQKSCVVLMHSVILHCLLGFRIFTFIFRMLAARVLLLV